MPSAELRCTKLRRKPIPKEKRSLRLVIQLGVTKTLLPIPRISPGCPTHLHPPATPPHESPLIPHDAAALLPDPICPHELRIDAEQFAVPLITHRTLEAEQCQHPAARPLRGQELAVVVGCSPPSHTLAIYVETRKLAHQGSSQWSDADRKAAQRAVSRRPSDASRYPQAVPVSYSSSSTSRAAGCGRGQR